jgi:exosortase/archaeosortase family protein
MELPRLSDPVKYVVRASCIAVLLYGMMQFLPVEKWTSSTTAYLLNFFGIDAVYYEENGRIYLEYLQISIDCTAVEIIAMFLGLIIATHSVISKKIIFSIFGVTAVFLANIFRISIVYYLLERGIPWYIAHDVFSGILAIMAGMLFLLISGQYMPQINENLYTLLDAAERFVKSKIL